MLVKQDRIKEAASLLWRMRIGRQRIHALPEGLRPATLAEGYAIQDAMVAISGQDVAGWKIAATSKAGQRHIGVDEPISGRLFAGFMLGEGARLEASPMHMRVAEAEFAFVMASDLPPRSEKYVPAQVKAAVAALHLAIEIPDARFERFAEIGAAQIAADDAFASWFMLGPDVPNWQDLDLPARPVRMSRNGDWVAQGRGADALGDPWLALTWLANHLSSRAIPLRKGAIVTTGTCIAPAAVSPGDSMIAEFTGLGQVAIGFD